ncbi:hypothetical protein [Sphingobacterium sp. 2149]|nr:hypothetical protein [Sphingobacterium sp. 2149]MDR6734945.1 hypothetical protein [Sphingobacterium sp. 2149]
MVSHYPLSGNLENVYGSAEIREFVLELSPGTMFSVITMQAMVS